MEYWPQDKARARLVGNQLHMEEPEMISFSRYVVNCFHGTPAKPKLPGQNTEHCEQTVDAQSMVRNMTELEQLRIFRQIENALPHMAPGLPRFPCLLYGVWWSVSCVCS